MHDSRNLCQNSVTFLIMCAGVIGLLYRFGVIVIFHKCNGEPCDGTCCSDKLGTQYCCAIGYPICCGLAGCCSDDEQPFGETHMPEV